MSRPAIRARGLGKRFRIGTREGRRTLLSALRHNLTGASAHRDLWALRGLDVDVERGEIFGVVGSNGAGKSTLLLLLAGILAPTEGTLDVQGKTDPFFQFAAALRPELAVKDNIALCAALLGIPDRQLKRRFDRIVEFSGLSDFLYARYGELSTGMAARLPFAVAVHADLDIILVDEMLSVGDRAFQQKCLETFRALSREGKTLVVVSHDLNLIGELCGRAVLLERGRAAYCGPAAEAAARALAIPAPR